MESGAVGFLLKDAPAAELARALRRAMEGERFVDPKLALLALSEGTVRNHLSTAMQKLGARNRMEAARLAEQKGWL